MVNARSFVRVDFAGGWTDIPHWRNMIPGAVVNATISIPTYAMAEYTSETSEVSSFGYHVKEAVASPKVKIYSADFDIYEEAENVASLEFGGKLDLAKAALKRLGIEKGVTLTTWSQAPPGSGLGTSAAMGVSIIAALVKLAGERLDLREIAELAVSLEVDELGLLSGKQDHYAAALGGFGLYTFEGDKVSHWRLTPSPSFLAELEKSCVLVYTGKSRLSSQVHEHVTTDLNTAAFEQLTRLASEAAAAIEESYLLALGHFVAENWRYQKELHPSITNEQIDSLFEAVKEHTYGGKACGAGGGGCVLFIAKPGREHLVRRALRELGVQILDFSFEHSRGLLVWYGDSV